MVICDVIWLMWRHFNGIIEITIENKDRFTHMLINSQGIDLVILVSAPTRMVNNNDVTYRDIHHLTQLHTLQLRRKTAR